MTEKYFVDTNVFVYARDKFDEEKREKSLTLIRKLLENNSGVISTQVITELSSVLSRKYSVPDDIIKSEVDKLLLWQPVIIDKIVLEFGLMLREQYKLSYWDAWIVAAANISECSYVLTEDLSHGARYHDVLIQNPYIVDLGDIGL